MYERVKKWLKPWIKTQVEDMKAWMNKRVNEWMSGWVLKSLKCVYNCNSRAMYMRNCKCGSYAWKKPSLPVAQPSVPQPTTAFFSFQQATHCVVCIQRAKTDLSPAIHHRLWVTRLKVGQSGRACMHGCVTSCLAPEGNRMGRGWKVTDPLLAPRQTSDYPDLFVKREDGKKGKRVQLSFTWPYSNKMDLKMIRKLVAPHKSGILLHTVALMEIIRDMWKTEASAMKRFSHERLVKKRQVLLRSAAIRSDSEEHVPKADVWRGGK